MTAMELGQVPGPAWAMVVQSEQESVYNVQVDASNYVFFLICGHLYWWFDRWGKHKDFEF